jgi:hypothetical protein
MRVVILRILYSLIQFAELYFLINFIHYFRENFTELLSAVRIGKNNLPLLEMNTVCSHMDADDLLKIVSSELDKYVIDKEFQHTNEFIFCVQRQNITEAKAFNLYFRYIDDVRSITNPSFAN